MSKYLVKIPTLMALSQPLITGARTIRQVSRERSSLKWGHLSSFKLSLARFQHLGRVGLPQGIGVNRTGT